ncbi:MAG: hypothetical protein ABEJ87_02540 [Candidatus Nanohalobium sp.]
MEIKSLEQAEELKEDVEKKVKEELGEPEASVDAKMAKEGRTEEFMEESALLSKLRPVTSSLEKADKHLDQVDIQYYRKLRDKHEEKRKYSDPDSYNDEEIKRSDKIYRSLNLLIKSLEGNREKRLFPEPDLEGELEGLEREKTVSNLLLAANKLSAASQTLKTENKHAITEESQEKLDELAETIEKERKELLEKAQDAEHYLRAAQKNIEELED